MKKKAYICPKTTALTIATQGLMALSKVVGGEASPEAEVCVNGENFQDIWGN